ncbi:MAG: FkbM family methyltransferase [Clostridia bacterium]|nr:FkbM family methyltransferase [Clostridia bacterium]
MKLKIESNIRSLDKNRPIVLFGAGNKGEKALKLLQNFSIRPSCFCDNNIKLQGQLYCDLPVFSYDKVQKMYSDYTLLLTATSKNAEQMMRQLRDAGERNPIYHFCIPFKVDNTLLSYEEVCRTEAYDKVYDFFEDKLSKELFIKLLEYKVTGNGLPLLKYESGKSFFDEKLIPEQENHAYVDVGAYTGDTIMKFCEFCRGKYTSITAFELDKSNFAKLQRFVEYSRLTDITLYNIGGWYEKSEITYYTLKNAGFENANVFSGIEDKADRRQKTMMEEMHCLPKEETAIVDAVDHVLAGERATIIKINALAADLEVLQGCKETIKKYKPVVIFDYGARPSHILEIPLLLKELRPDYKLVLRQKEIFGDSKTVLWAI